MWIKRAKYEQLQKAHEELRKTARDLGAIMLADGTLAPSFATPAEQKKAARNEGALEVAGLVIDAFGLKGSYPDEVEDDRTFGDGHRILSITYSGAQKLIDDLRKAVPAFDNAEALANIHSALASSTRKVRRS